jgi:hypothetical protein
MRDMPVSTLPLGREMRTRLARTPPRRFITRSPVELIGGSGRIT